MKKQKILYKVRLLILTIVCILMSAVTVSAETSIPTQSYTYWRKGDSTEKKAVLIRPLLEVKLVLDGSSLNVGSLSEASYIASDKDGNIYILDSGNSRIIVLNEKLQVSGVKTPKDTGGAALNINGAKGISVFKNGVCIADTENKRVLICDSDFNVLKTVVKPTSYLIPKDFRFEPIRALFDNKGFLYVLCSGSYYGAMVFSDTYEFMGFYGADSVEGNILGTVRQWFTDILTTDVKQAGQLQKLPFQFTDICCSEDGFIYTSSEGSQWKINTGELRKLGPAGGNILTLTSCMKKVNGDNFTFGDNDFNYTGANARVASAFTAITVDGEGYMYAIDRSSGKLFFYDEQCNLLNVVGGGIGSGTQKGTFITPTAIALSGDNVCVLDEIKSTVTVFKLTDFGTLVKKASTLTNKGEYVKAKPLWEEVKGLEKNCQMAYIGLAKAALYEQDYKTAMEYSKQGLDQQTYTAAFSVIKNRFVKKYFLLIFFFIVLLIVGLSVFMVISRKRDIILIKHEGWRNALSVLTHPFKAFSSISRNNTAPILIPTLFLAAFFIGKVAERTLGGFMYVLPDPEFSLSFTFLGTCGIVLIGVLCNWCTAILFEGKGTVRKCYCALCYCLTPQIIYSVLFVVMTQFVVPGGSSTLKIIELICSVVTVIWILLAITVVHEFSFFKAIGMFTGTLLSMCLVGFILFLLLVLAQDFGIFLINLYREAFFR